MNDRIQAAFRPIQMSGEVVETQLQVRAEHPDLWRSLWPDEPDLLAARDRFGRLLICFCRWPNAFFIPEDDINGMIDAGDFESLDLLDFIMTLEEVFNLGIDDDQAHKMPLSYRAGSTYEQQLRWLIEISDFSRAITGTDYEWRPFQLPPDYFERSFRQSLKRLLPFTWSDSSLHRDFRHLQVGRPPTWIDQWAAYDDRVIQLRDQVSPILVEELDWFDEAFIPQDRLEAVFHSASGLKSSAPPVLKKINQAFKSEIEFDFIASGRHTYADFLKKLAETVTE
jgi:hypothetical protein